MMHDVAIIITWLLVALALREIINLWNDYDNRK
jgi:1,4-dihydroxy-2-naphthoate octaprenyltransferase